jgi:hypothetical protein
MIKAMPRGGDAFNRGNVSHRHAELVSASICRLGAGAASEKWTLKQVQGDEDGGDDIDAPP